MNNAVKFDSNKPRWALLPVKPIEAVVQVLTYGAVKYGPDNWRKGFDYTRLISAVDRHWADWKCGQDLDPETKLFTLAHMMCSLVFLLEYQILGIGNDDRYKYPEYIGTPDE